MTEGYTQQEPYFHMDESDIKNVNVSLNIVNFLKVYELGQTIKVVFEIDRTWFDSQLILLEDILWSCVFRCATAENL